MHGVCVNRWRSLLTRKMRKCLSDFSKDLSAFDALNPDGVGSSLQKRMEVTRVEFTVSWRPLADFFRHSASVISISPPTIRTYDVSDTPKQHQTCCFRFFEKNRSRCKSNLATAQQKKGQQSTQFLKKNKISFC